MKNHLKPFHFFLLLLTLYRTETYAFNKLWVADPRGGGKSGQGSIDSATVVLKPKGLFIEVSLYLNFSAASLNFSNKDTLEITYNFDLPEEAIVTDSWLWLNDDVIIKGKLLDLWTASTIYENIVRRRRDPSILKKHSQTQYELRIFPMAGNSYRKVKIVYLLPLELNNNNLSYNLKLSHLQVSRVLLPKVNVSVFNESDYEEPSLYLSNNIRVDVLKKVDPIFGTALIKQIELGEFGQGVLVNYPLKNPAKSIYSTFELNNERFYQIGIPLKKFIETSINKNVIIALDYNKANSVAPQTLIKELELLLKSDLNSLSKFNVCFMKGFIVSYAFNDWVQANETNINLAIETIKQNNIGNANSTAPMISSILQKVGAGSSPGSVLFITSDNSLSDPFVNNQVIGLLQQEGLSKLPFHIVDINNVTRNCNFIANIYYCNSQYFFTNISRITQGSYIIQNGNQLTETLKKSLNNSQGIIYNLEIHTKSEQGFCYNRYFSKNLSSFSINDYVIQVGKYTGQVPFSFEISGFIDTKSFSIAHQIPIENTVFSDLNVTKSWAGYHVREIEKNNSQSAIINSIFYSQEYNVLSKNTAFLCLEDSSYFCNNCIDETKINTDTKESKKDSIQLKAYPNPFSDIVKIELTGKFSAKDDIKINIFNSLGTLVDELKDLSTTNDKMSYSWRPVENINSGLYYINLFYGDINIVKKVMYVKQ